MSRRTHARIQFDALTIEGGLLPAEWLGRVAALDAPAQSPADYGVPKGLQLRDEIGRYWRIAEALWAEFASGRAQPGHDAAGAARSFVRQLLTEVLGFAELAPGGEVEAGGRRFPVTYQALGGRVPVFVGAPGERLDDPVMRHGDGVRRRSAWGALQEYLNAAEDALWGLASNGLLIRLGRDNASLTRPAWLEADLERIFTDGLFADFSALWLVLHASRLGRADQAADAAPLEAWRAAGREEGSRARDQLRKGVEAALRELGQGFVAHPRNTALRYALATGALTPGEYFNELLRLVYRMIFLLTVEEREILHAEGADAATRALYREGYGMRRLRDRAVRSTLHDRHGDLWASLLPVFAGLGRARGEPALELPGLGGLFAPEQCPTLDACALDNRSLLISVFRLAWLREPGALSRVNWKDMGPEELGSVYESLLELVPRVSTDAREFGFAGAAESAGNTRKLTGSYYTPDALVQQLLDTALEPVVAQRLAAHPENLADALLSISVIDPACGSGHFLLAAARRLAGHLARAKAGGTPGAAEYRHALREVVTHCIYGVDRNPMALELARMALWLEAFSPDRALGFLDHHLVCGDALLGLMDLSAVRGGIPDEAFKALTGDDKEVGKALAKRNRDHRKALTKADDGQYAIKLSPGPLGKAFDALDALQDDDVDAYEAKRRRFLELHSTADESPAALAADCFLAAFLSPKRVKEDLDRVPTSRELLFLLEGSGRVSPEAAAHARKICRDAHVLHWPLAFPQVFEDGGFDLVIANPPWERVKIEEREWFAWRDPELARARNAAERGRSIGQLADSNPTLYAEYRETLHVNEAANVFFRDSGRFPLCGRGDVNTYSIFSELATSAIGRDGQVGLIIPTGIATDATTQHYFRWLVDEGRLVSLYDFENRDRLFPAVAPVQKFCLLTLRGVGRRNTPADFVFFATRVQDLADPARHFHLSTSDFALLNPNTRTCPLFRSRLDAEITKAVYSRVPILVREGEVEENAWEVVYRAMFHSSGDSHLFRSKEDFEKDGFILVGNRFVHGDVVHVPVIEGKLFHQYNHRYNTYAGVPAADRFKVKAAARSFREHWEEPTAVILPRYWVREQDARERWIGSRRWALAFRNTVRVTTDRRTAVFSAVPFAGYIDKAPLLYVTNADPAAGALLLGNFSSFVYDYALRQSLGGASFSAFILKQTPVLAPPTYAASAESLGAPTLREWVLSRVVELVYTSWEMGAFAEDCGVAGPPFQWDENRRFQIQCELDALYFHLYGLSESEVGHIMDSFRIVRDQEEASSGVFRSKRTILQLYREMAPAFREGRCFTSIVEPKPAHPRLQHNPEALRSPVVPAP